MILSSGCSWQTGFASAQAWQRNACQRLVDAVERDRCLAGTNLRYDDYRRKVDEAGQPPR